MMKMTKKEKFAMAMEVIGTTNVADKDVLLECLAHEIELLEKKSGKSGQSKTQKANMVLKDEMLIALKDIGESVTVSEFMNLTRFNASNDFSNQKVSAMLNQLVKDGRAVKTIDKKKSYFSVGE